MKRFAILFGIILALGSVAPLQAAGAPSSVPNAGILPANGTAYGRSYGAWSGAWWQYVLAQPTASNPLLDSTGAGCGSGQSGPVFFLTGAFGSGAVTRDDCIVGRGKALFFPLLNGFDVHVPGDGLDTAQQVWDDLHVTIGFGPFFELHATIDGVPVKGLDPATTPYRTCAGPVSGCAASFSVTFPEDNLFGVPAGTYAPAVADGFYLLLAPLSPGPHTVTFGGSGTFGGSAFSQDITYLLVVSAS